MYKIQALFTEPWPNSARRDRAIAPPTLPLEARLTRPLACPQTKTKTVPR